MRIGSKLFKLGILLALLAVFLLSATPVYADTEWPDSDPTIDTTNVYRNLLEEGDWLIVIYANIPYADLPDTPVTQTFIWRLIALDGETELGRTVGYTYHDSGYGYNVYSMYFTEAEVDDLGLLWDTGYTIRLSGNPAVFDTPPIYNYSLVIADYSTLEVTADVKAELAARILTLASDIDVKWGLATAYSLLTQSETATILSTYGEAFFRGAIYGLQAMAPAVFSVVVRAIDIDPREWDPEYTENVTSQWAGTWVETAQEAGKALFGTEYDLLSIIILLIMCGGLMVGNIALTGDHWNGLIDITLLGIVGARLAMYDLGFLILVAAMCWLYISAKIWFGMIR